MSLTGNLLSTLKKEEETNFLAKNVSVLLVEDNSNDAALTERVLESVGLKVTWANSAELAMEKLYASLTPAVPNFSLVFLDLKLPGMSGVQLLQKIRALTPDLHVIIFTGAPDNQSLSEAMRLGYTGLLGKPVKKPDVTEILQKHKIGA